MPGTRTAPAVTGTANFKLISVHFLDATGDERTITVRADTAVSNAVIEAYIAALQLISNATADRIEVTSVFNSVGDSSNALAEVHDSLYSNLVLLSKNATDDSQRYYVPAPILALFIAGKDEIDPANTDLAAFMTAALAVRSGFSFTQARYTERREINEAVKF